MLMAEGGSRSLRWCVWRPWHAPFPREGCSEMRCWHPGAWGAEVSVAESALAPPGPIPNPVVTQGSAGEYCGGDPVGGEAAAGTPAPPGCSGPHEIHPFASRCRGVEQRQLVGLITQRSRVRIPPPPLPLNDRDQKRSRSFLFCLLDVVARVFLVRR